MLVLDQTGTKSVPFEKWPFFVTSITDLSDIEPEIEEKFKRENLWYAIVAVVGYEDAYVMGGYDTYEKAKKQFRDLFKLYNKGVKSVQLNESSELDEDDKFNADKALRRILLF